MDPADILVYDVESKGLRPELGETMFAAAACRLADPGRITVYWLDQADDRDMLIEELRQAKAILAHNGKFDMRQTIRSFGLPLDFFDAKQILDTRIRAIHAWPGLHHVRVKGQATPFGLKSLTRNATGVPGDEKRLKAYLSERAKRLYGHKGKMANWTAAERAEKTDYSLVPRDILKPYLVGDIVRTVLLWRTLEGPVAAMPEGTRRQMLLDESLLLPALRMELRGLPVSKPALLAQREALKSQMKTLRGRLPFDPQSRTDLAEQFGDHAERLGCRSKVRDAKTGLLKLTYDRNSLQRMSEKGVPFAQEVLDFRFCAKRLGTYVEEWLPYADLGRLHCYVNVAGPHTGRMSSSEPNLQNVPKDKAGSALRQCIVPEAGCVLIAVDWSQLEYWCVAHLANDARLRQVLAEEDLHGSTAEALFGLGRCPRDYWKHDPGKHQRQGGKTFNFAAVFGATDWKLKRQLETEFPGRVWSLNEIQAQMRNWQQRFPVTSAWRSMVTRSAEMGQTREDLFGRRHPPQPRRAYAMVNHLVQGFGAGVMKRAFRDLSAAGLDIRMLIHDEVIVSCPDDPEAIRQATRQILGIMQRVDGYQFPAEASVCRLSLGEKVKYDHEATEAPGGAGHPVAGVHPVAVPDAPVAGA